MKYRCGALRVQLSSSLYSINAAINAVLAARAQVTATLVCEAEVTEEVAGHFRYFLALIGHMYCYAFEVTGPKVYITMPARLNQPTCALSAPDLDVLFVNSDYLLDYDVTAIQGARVRAGLRPVVVQHLVNVQMRHFPPFNYPLSSEPTPALREVVLGGTFDFLHPGHLILLTCLSLVTTAQIHLALTDDELLKNKRYKAFLQSYRSRERDLAHAMRFIAPHVPIHIFSLADPVGPAATEPWDGIILSREVESAGDKINEIRRKNGLHSLVAVTVDLVQLGTQKMSSTDIRALLSERCSGHGDALLAKWLELCVRLGLSPATAKDWWSEISTAYLRYDRHAHTLSAVFQMLQTASGLNLALSPSMELAVWFVYYVLEPDAEDNIEQSASACSKFIEEARASGCEQAPTLIRALKNSVSEEEQLLEDLTLSPFSCEAEQYHRYATLSRREFSYWTAYTVQRIQLLASLLARPTVYHTALFQEKFESQARANMRRELEQIGARSAQL